MLKSLKDKKGEMTTQQIVMLVILIVSFIIILIFIFLLNPGEQNDKQICRNSVVLNDKASLVSDIDCKTNYLCISGGGNCENFNPSETIKVKSDDKTETMEVISNSMVDCRWMFGEGEINYGERGGTDVRCALCSVIMLEGTQEISYSELYSYLESTKKDNAQTYLNYLYGIFNKESFRPEEQFDVDIIKDKIVPGERYSVITGIDDNLVGKDAILDVYLIPTKETSSRTGCDEFITRA